MLSESFAAISLISFREGLEAAILVALIVAVLRRMGRHGFVGVALVSALASVLIGVLAGWVVLRVYGGLPEKELFEGAMSLLAAGLVTTVIVWMARAGPRMAREVESRLSVVSSAAGVALFTFVAVSREALETVLMSTPYLVRDPAGSLAGLALGLGASLLLASAIYAFGVRMSLRRFFLATSILLVFVASGLVGYGVHEILEYAEEDLGYTGILTVKAFDLGIPEGHPLDPASPLGSLLSVLVGYSDSMEVGRAIAQFAYLAASLALVLSAYDVRVASLTARAQQTPREQGSQAGVCGSRAASLALAG